MTPARRGVFVLAERLHIPVYILERDMPARELAEWYAYWAETKQPAGMDASEVGGEAYARALGATITEET